MRIEWEDPPERKEDRPAKYREFADALRAHPMQWAVLGREEPSAYTGHIKSGKLKAFQPAGAFEARYRESEDSKAGKYKSRTGARKHRGTIWVRYVGGSDAEPT